MVMERNYMMILFSIWLVYHLWLTICLNNVNKKTAKIPSCCVVILYSLFEDILQTECHPCKIDLLYANCANLSSKSNPLDLVPQDLDPNIEDLDLSNNVIKKFNQESFKNYKKLISLLLFKVTVQESILNQSSIFRPLEQLKILNMSNFSSKSKLNYYWPLSLKTLDVCNISHEIGEDLLDVSDLVNLEILDGRSNSLKELPNMHQLAPLKFVDLRLNPLDHLTVEVLAKYCNIHHMEILLTETNSFLSEQPFYCKCIQLNEWFKVYEIKSEHNFRCWINETSPGGIPLEYPNCDPRFSQVALDQRQNCLLKGKGSNVIAIIAIVVGSIVILILCLGCITYKYGMLQKKVKTGELEIVDNKSSDQSEPNDDDGEEED